MNLDEYFSRNHIINYLCKQRAKLSNKRGKQHLIHLLTNDPEKNYHINIKDKRGEIKGDEKTLLKILPSRRKWKKLRKDERYENGQRINSIKLNERSLRKTILYFEKVNPKEPFLVELNRFIQEVQDSINQEGFSFEEPTIFPQKKIKKKSVKVKYRPVANYSLKDKIIIGLVNRYLTQKFDCLFFDNTLAFRLNDLSSLKGELPHHAAIRKICKQRELQKQKEVWVAECDIKNFFDCVNHTVIKKAFNSFVRKAEKEHKTCIDQRAISIFKKYLDSYTFYKNAYLLKNNSNYKAQHSLPEDFEFGWVKDDLIQRNFYKKIDKRSKIGIPQGGALSGLIANIVLHWADKAAINIMGKTSGYYRYCDDIIIIHPEIEKTKSTLQAYKEALSQLKLVYHDFKDLNVKEKKGFWEEKSKNQYLWTNDPTKGMEWIGFLGYEIRHDNNIRVRKISLEREKEKQKKVVSKILNSIKEGQRRSKDSILESATHRLFGMAVGRVTLYNYKNIKPELCWINGFKELNYNKWSAKQLKILDRNREKELCRLKNKVANLETLVERPPKVRSWEFTRIKGISKIASQNIREELKNSKVLKMNFRLKIKNSELDEIDLGLSQNYIQFKNEIVLVLKNLVKNRCVGYYGKPYSYYYQGLKNKGLNQTLK